MSLATTFPETLVEDGELNMCMLSFFCLNSVKEKGNFYVLLSD